MPLLLAIFGIENDGVNLALNLLILFLVVVYLALIAYTFLDSRRRLEDPVLVGCATVAALFPFVGTIVYTILRPPEFLDDRRERALEIRASELRVRQLEESSCPSCEHPVERTYLRCPNCRARIKDPCESCGKPVDPRWSLCPYCETPVRQAVAPEAPSTRRRRSSTSEAPPSRPARAKRPVSRSAAPDARPKSSGTKAARPVDRERPKNTGAGAAPPANRERAPRSRPERPPGSASS